MRRRKIERARRKRDKITEENRKAEKQILKQIRRRRN
jgi:hypothetical protein